MARQRPLRTKKWRESNEHLGHPRNPSLRPGAGSMSEMKQSDNLFMLGVKTDSGWPKDGEGREMKPVKDE